MSGQWPDDQEGVESRQRTTVGAGEVFDVSADDLVSAGYRWVVSQLPAGLVLLGEDMVGARRTFRFVGERPGRYDVRLALLRPWEASDVPPADTRSLRVEVLSAGPGSDSRSPSPP